MERQFTTRSLPKPSIPLRGWRACVLHWLIMSTMYGRRNGVNVLFVGEALFQCALWIMGSDERCGMDGWMEVR